MEDFAESQPFIVVRSQVYFQWLSLRLRALKEVQLLLAIEGPSNLGISTSVLMHLMRQTVHSPIIDKPYLAAALRDLRYQEIMQGFGMFFLHELDTDLTVINQIETVDPEECRKYFLNTNNHGRSLNKFQVKIPEPPNTSATLQYPCGETPDYPTWQRTLLNSQEPACLVTQWSMEEDFADCIGHLATELFMGFTMDLIHAITLDYVKGGYPEAPRSLEEAMGLWTVERLDGLLLHTEFISSNWGLEGTVKGPRDKDPKHTDVFFPASDAGLQNSGWEAVLRQGYLKRYFEIKSTKSRKDFVQLRQELRKILRRLQCLPAAAPPKGRLKGTIWIEGKRGFQIWVNPTYYRLKKLAVVKGGGERVRKRKGLKGVSQQVKDFENLRRVQGQELDDALADLEGNEGADDEADTGADTDNNADTNESNEPNDFEGEPCVFLSPTFIIDTWDLDYKDETHSPSHRMRSDTEEEDYCPRPSATQKKGTSTSNAGNATQKRDRRSLRSKNKRVPPQKRNPQNSETE